MKKYLFIFLSLISINSFSLTEGEFEVIQDINSNVADLETNVQLIHNGLNSYLFSEDYRNLISQLSEFFSYESPFGISLLDFYARQESIEYSIFWIHDLLDLQNNYLLDISEKISSDSILHYLTDGKVADNINSIEDRMENLQISVTQLGDKYDQVIAISGNNQGLLNDVLGELRLISGSSGGSGSGDLPIDIVGYYELGEYGKDVNIEGLAFDSVTTTGEYNKDVLRLLLNLNHVGGSHLNSSLSILTNVQAIAESLASDDKGEEESERDVEQRKYKAQEAVNEANSINSIDWSSYFTPPKCISESWNNLTISLYDSDLPERITVIDTFHFDSAYFNLEIGDLGYDVPQKAVELAFYVRQGFAFIYWTLSFWLALLIFKYWIKLYFYVSKSLFDK